MSVFILPRESQFTIYFYDEGCDWEHKDPHRAVIQASFIEGKPGAIELTGGTGRIKPGDDKALIKALKAHGFLEVFLESKKGRRVSRYLKKVDETEHTNIFYADLRELNG